MCVHVCVCMFAHITCAVSSKMSSSSDEAEPGWEESELPSSSSYRILFTWKTTKYSNCGRVLIADDSFVVSS